MQKSGTVWERKAKDVLQSAMARRKLSYRQLADKLGEMGLVEDESNLRIKIGRGKFTAAFLLACLSALDSNEIFVKGRSLQATKTNAFEGE